MPDSLLIQAHPRRDKMETVDPSLLDEVEIFNMHPNHNSRNGLTSAAVKAQGGHFLMKGNEGANWVLGTQYPAEFAENFTGQIGRWCEENGIAYEMCLYKRK